MPTETTRGGASHDRASRFEVGSVAFLMKWCHNVTGCRAYIRRSVLVKHRNSLTVSDSSRSESSSSGPPRSRARSAYISPCYCFTRDNQPWKPRGSAVQTTYRPTARICADRTFSTMAISSFPDCLRLSEVLQSRVREVSRADVSNGPKPSAENYLPLTRLPPSVQFNVHITKWTMSSHILGPTTPNLWDGEMYYILTTIINSVHDEYNAYICTHTPKNHKNLEY